MGGHQKYGVWMLSCIMLMLLAAARSLQVCRWRMPARFGGPRRLTVALTPPLLTSQKKAHTPWLCRAPLSADIRACKAW